MSDSDLNSPQLVPGYRLDRYELLCPVARGGMAAVWLARFQGKHGFEKLVAVKTILPSFATDVEFRRMFLDEATIASRIEHTNVAQILDLGEHDGILYLVMEWVEGDPVARLERAVQQAGGVIPQAIALRIASDSCAGLHAAHQLCDDTGRSLGVVHRDVSPQNILVSAKGVVKLIDFGIAKARDRASEDTRSGVFKGKLQYMAPEQALGKAVDRRADVWAIAAVLYKLLARRPVHEGRSRVDALRSLTSNEPLVPLPEHVATEVAEVVIKALSFEPSDRYENCFELQKALDRAIHAESLYLTTGELSAFVNQHLASQLEARRANIKSSMLALTGNATQNVLPWAADGSSPDQAQNGDAGGGHQPSTVPPRVWQPAQSEASLTAGSTSLYIEAKPAQSGLKRKRVAFGVALLAVGALAALVWKLSDASHRAPVASAAIKSPAMAARSAAPGATLASTALASAMPGAAIAPSDAAAEPTPAVSVVSVESLAIAPVAPITPVVAKVRPATTSVSKTKRKRKVIDDGF